MARNIVICCDGTANEFATNATNVIRLFSCLVQDPARQVAIYQPGLGTIEATGALTATARLVTRLLGKAFGLGLEHEMVQAYAAVMRFYQPGDQVFLFGFSRGAYTVRAVAAMIHLYGVLRPGQEVMIPYAIRMAANCGGPALEAQAERMRATFDSPRREIHFVGVWDTVSSVGWIENPLRLPYTANNPSTRIARHAVAIDERRAFFRTNLYRPAKAPYPSGPTDLQQVWFPGVHSDVGGGYPDAEGGMSKYSLAWMAAEAEKAGLLLDPARLAVEMGLADGEYSAPDPQAQLHESLTWKWWLAEFLPKRHYNWATGHTEHRMNLFRRRTVPKGANVHEVAWLRSGYAVPDGATRFPPPPTGPAAPPPVPAAPANETA